ncbi:molybdate ABC transporter permease subunit [Leptospira meyeri]|uniref:molybdate ABC transporter permease subunit n=1 Tax=Leptospira meyeri TaxID=29508 RepID=UPI000C2969DA|nr:molybdate ABC transporter permease subunit [Leptospira meyeri]PKA26794.1 molybdate ABC transporter permease subunit [Leptospira sp. mixed culture ATI2-C-A1]PJZ80719.1 molybdate ABC transporter permease subunit [Leptospira meyeri]PJZ96222.1 molybdate ABC transporter permease subunit [Leptospira meyeri]TGM22521.1 molybdate ABC transporter permease subunit [Leptospira meyeri]TGM59748.1 molybdate ABC transporter permease subunit [Leptospira meyeri]
MILDFDPLWLTLKLAFCTTILLSLITIPIAYWLTFSSFRFRFVLETVLNLPLVLPPTVLGFYLLIFFSPNHWLGRWIEEIFHFRIAFSFLGILIGSIFFSLPFMLQAYQVGFSSISKIYIETAMVLGKSKWTILFRVILPNCKAAILAGMVLTFAHTIGEFGVVLLIGGSIPGKTKVASIAIFEEVEAMNYVSAHIYAAILVCISMFFLLLLFRYKRNLTMILSSKN